MTRLLQSLAALLFMSLATFMLIGLMPGDPVDLMIAGNPHMTPEDALRLRALYGLDQPLGARYLHWLAAALQGDFGYSRLFSLPVLDVLWPRLLNTAVLMGLSLICTLALAIPAGVYAAHRKGSMLDRALNLFCFAGISLPPFWCALLLMSLFAVTLQWLPASARLEDGASLVMPLMTLTLANLALYARHTRSAMIEHLRADHIRTARAKGCSDNRILWRHAFKNALPPVVTLLMLDLGTLFGGALTVETVFAFPGMGKLMFDAVMGNDYNLALVGFLLLTAFVLLANYAADAMYGLLDPRVRTKK